MSLELGQTNFSLPFSTPRALSEKALQHTVTICGVIFQSWLSSFVANFCTTIGLLCVHLSTSQTWLVSLSTLMFLNSLLMSPHSFQRKRGSRRPSYLTNSTYHQSTKIYHQKPYEQTLRQIRKKIKFVHCIWIEVCGNLFAWTFMIILYNLWSTFFL